jgi:hypothetical protein
MQLCLPFLPAKQLTVTNSDTSPIRIFEHIFLSCNKRKKKGKKIPSGSVLKTPFMNALNKVYIYIYIYIYLGDYIYFLPFAMFENVSVVFQETQTINLMVEGPDIITPKKGPLILQESPAS